MPAEELGPPCGRLTGQDRPTRTSTGLPRSARMSYDRGGCPLYPGDGGAHPGPSGVLGRRLPLHGGQSLDPCSSHPSTGVHFTRHQRGFKQFTRPAIPLARGRPDGTSRRLSFPPGSAPRRPRADDARQGGDRPSSTDLELHAQHHISRSSNRVAHSQRATSCRNAKGAHLRAVDGEAPGRVTSKALLSLGCGSALAPGVLLAAGGQIVRSAQPAAVATTLRSHRAPLPLRTSSSARASLLLRWAATARGL
jgi:hypothetical protein